MFQGTLPQPVVRIIGKIVKEWDTKRIYVGCSGNFTIERSISGLISCPITSNDVTIYSSYIGKFFAGESLKNLQIKEEFVGKYRIFNGYMDTDADKIATLIIASDMLSYDKPGEYFQRMYGAYVEQFPRMHKQLVEKLVKVKTKIDTFYNGDVMELLDQVGPQDGFISFPPFYGGGYEKMWSKLEEVFFYEKPQYEQFDPDKVLHKFCDKIKQMNNYVICTERPVEELSNDLIGCSETAKGKAVYVYGKSTQTHFIEARVKNTNAKPIIKITKDYKLTGDIKIKRINVDQFIENKSMYLSTRVKSTANPQSMYALYDGTRCFGFFGISDSYMLGAPESYEGPSIYLMSDFAVSPTCEPKLSKLVLYCILSKEVKMLAEHSSGKRINLINTNVFSKNPVSMKYRGLFELAGAKELEKDESGKVTQYNLSYVAKPGKWTLKEGYEQWRQKYSE